MNLLIAIMSETTGKISAEMQSREKLLKLSSISIIRGRLNAARVLTCGFCKKIKTIGGRRVNLKFLFHKEIDDFSSLMCLRTYYEDLHYCCTLEEESIEVDYDEKVQ